MKTKTLVVLAFIFCSQVNGQKSDVTKLNLKGNVKSIRESMYQVNKKEGKIHDTILEYVYYNTFDKQGNKIEDFKYDTKGKIDKKYEYIYDNLGRRIFQNQYASDGKLNRKMNYIYDEKGNITEDNSFTSEGKLGKKYTYTYDISGNKLENNRYTTDGRLDKKVNYKYDDKGNVIEEIQTANDGKKAVYSFEYTYNTQNNWIQKDSFNGKLIVSIIKREIEYY